MAQIPIIVNNRTSDANAEVSLGSYLSQFLHPEHSSAYQLVPRMACLQMLDVEHGTVCPDYQRMSSKIEHPLGALNSSTALVLAIATKSVASSKTSILKHHRLRHLVRYILHSGSATIKDNIKLTLTPFLVGMITTTMLVFVGSDARGKRRGVRRAITVSLTAEKCFMEL